jgi:pectate lyase
MAAPRFAWVSRGLGSLLLAGGLCGCGTDVAQTATTMPEAPAGLDCTPPATPPELPSEPELGGGAKLTTNWLLQAGDYGADQGPGIAIAARDGFRLFVNGRLLAESTDSLSPVFERLTLLPGVNAVSVVVTASTGPPALLALVDELERPYVSDASWKVSSDPSGDWSAATYDDSGPEWATAQDLGSPEENPGCDPGPGFPKGSGAVWVGGPSEGSAVFRRKVSIAPVGFAAGTTGGGTTEPLRVTTTDALVAALKGDAPAVIVLDEGSLDVHRTGDDITTTMACPTPCEDFPGMMTKNLISEVDTCDAAMVPAERTERRISVTSDKTLVGLGRGAQLFGATLDIGSSKNVIVRNVALYGVNPDLIEAGDGISLDQADGIWVDHVTFEAISDGFIDATTGSQNVTFSWLRNNGYNLFACGTKHPRSNELADTTATIHHTLWQQVFGRAPLARGEGSLVHLFNDVVLDDPSYAVGSDCGAQVLLEASSFDNVATPTSKPTCAEPDATPGLISAQGHGNQYGNGRHQANGLPADEPNDTLTFTPSYEYTSVLESAETARFVVEKRAGAGSRWALPLDYP